MLTSCEVAAVRSGNDRRDGSSARPSDGVRVEKSLDARKGLFEVAEDDKLGRALARFERHFQNGVNVGNERVHLARHIDLLPIELALG